MKADLSIIVTNYNKSKKELKECFDSIKEQTIDPREIILVDDCSDKPQAHSFATSILLPKNVGVAKARDIGVKMSVGRLLLFVDADDKLSPDFIEQCGMGIAKADIVYPSLLLFGEIEKNKLVNSPKKITPDYIIGKKCALPVTSMMHRFVYEELNGFKDLPIFEDWDFWIRAIASGFKFKRANTLLYYRQNKTSRNTVSIEYKREIHKKMTAPYIVKDGRLIERKNG